MPKKITLDEHLTTDQLFKRYRGCRHANEKVRWRALFLISSGIRAAQAARCVGRTSGWMTQLVQRYNKAGEKAVADQRSNERKAGPQPTITAELALELQAALHEAAPDGGLWTAKKVADWIAARTGRRLHETSAWRCLRSLGFTLQTVRPQHRQAASASEQEAFKKKLTRDGRRT